MAKIEILPQKIVDTRTIILKSKFDSIRVRAQGEELKSSFFARFGFLKPNPKDVLLVAFGKYYEPYILIGGKYSIDYCKRHGYALEVEDRTQALFIAGKKLKPESLSESGGAKVINLMGEEHAHYENETYIVLDRTLQEVSPENLFFAPSESEVENEPASDFDLRRAQISLEEEITFLRSKIAKRPSDVAEIIREKFEINERIIIYSPVYELTYKNVKNGKNVTVLINGITGDVIIVKFDVQASKKLGDSLETYPENLATIKKRFFRIEPQSSQVHDETYFSNSNGKASTEDIVVEKEAATVAISLHSPRDPFQFKAENTAHLATDFMTRLGCKQDQFPTELYVDGERDVVELKLQKGITKVQIDTKTR